MMLVTGDGNGGRRGDGVWPFSEGKRGTRRGNSTVPEVDDTAKSAVTAREVEGGGWRLEVEDDQRKSGLWAEWAVGLNCLLTEPTKNMVESMR
jgi:hypothetical protein